MKPKNHRPAALFIAFVASPLAGAVDYTFTGTTTGTTTWSSGTNWNAAPVSASTTDLIFGTGQTLASAVNILTTQDITTSPTPFLLNSLTTSYSGSGTEPQVRIQTGPMSFVSDGLTTPTIALNSTGTTRPLLVFLNAVNFGNNISIGGDSSVNFSGVLTAANGVVVTKTGAGTMRVDSTNASYAGNFGVTGGILQVGNNGSGGNLGTGTVTLSGGGAFTVRKSGNLTLNNTIEGTGNVTFQLRNSAIVTVNKANTYNGTTTISPTASAQVGKVQLGINNGLSTSTALTITNNGASVQTFDLAGFDQTLGSLATSTGGSTTNSIVTNSGVLKTLTISGTTTTTYAGLLSGALNLSKGGTGTLNLTGANAYTGQTTLNQGTLTVGTGGTLGATTGALSVNNTNSTAAGTAAILNLSTALDTTVGTLSGTIATPTSGTNTATINTQTGRNFTVNQTAAASFAGEIAGAGNFTLGSTSNNVLTLSGTNTYAGTTQVDGGTLVFGKTSAKAAGTVTAAAAGTVGLGIGGAGYYSAANVGDLFNTNTLSGFSLASASGVAIDTTNAAGGSFDQDVALTAARALTKLGSGTLVLSQENSYTGLTTVNAGVLQVANNNGLGGTAAGTVVNGTNNGFVGTVLDLNGVSISSGESLTMASGGTASARVSLRTVGTTTNTWAGGVSLTGSRAVQFFANTGGQLEISGAITHSAFTGTVSIRGAGTGILSGGVTLSGTTDITVNDGGTWNVNTIGNTWGNTNAYRGTLVLGANDALPTTTSLNLGGDANSGTLKLNGKSQTVAGLTTTGTGTTNKIVGGNATAGALTVNNSTANSFSGVLGGTGTDENNFSLTKSGEGELTLSGASTYTGATLISGGTLVMGDAVTDTFSTAAVTVASDAKLAGAGTIAGTAVVTGILAPGIAGVSGGIGTLAAGETTWNGAATSNAATIWQFDLSANSNASDALAIIGDFKKDSSAGTVYEFNFMNSAPTTWGNVYTLVTWTGTSQFTSASEFTWSNLGGAYDLQPGTGFTLNANSLTFTAVPEPTSALAGLLITAGLLRRRRNA